MSEPTFDHPLFSRSMAMTDYTSMAMTDYTIAVFRFEEYVEPSDEAQKYFDEVMRAISNVPKENLAEFEKYKGRIRVEAPRSYRQYREGVKERLEKGRCAGTDLEAELVRVVEDAGYIVFSTWDNGGNDGHGFSIAFR